MTTQTNHTDNQFYVGLTSIKPLSKEDVRAFYRFVKSSIASGLMSSLQVERPGYGLDTVRLIHRQEKSGLHVYEIPLSRHLTDKEFDELEKEYQHLAVEGQVLITSGIRLQDALRVPAGERFEPEIFDTFCDTLAKLQHSNWMLERQNAGWRYALEHNVERKTSPLLRPWEDLPPQYRKVDKKFPKQILELIESLDFVIIPKTELEKLIKKKR